VPAPERSEQLATSQDGRAGDVVAVSAAMTESRLNRGRGRLIAHHTCHVVRLGHGALQRVLFAVSPR